mgnify:CR=1 FL=1
MDTEWKKLNQLRKIDDSISNLLYSREYAAPKITKRKKKKTFYFPNKTVYIFQRIEIKESEQGKILWRNCEYKGTDRITKYDTQFGEMTSDDRGEFGGVLYTPFGNIDGNFCDVFDFEDKVYAVHSLAHLLSLYFGLYEISKDGNINEVYSLTDYFKGKDYCEDLAYCAKYIRDDHNAYILIAGYVKQLKEEFGETRYESRLIHICNGVVDTIMVIPEWIPEVTNMIVTDDYVYLGHDKMLSIIDRKTKAIEYRTFLSGKAVKNLLKSRY